ncbi:hypothetical protein BD410DRAFT_55168 [Rickenella mellea]|uniref:Uncharacterized protein n=1 Tax=Rickenella mellea TaxID=50990 RepID=A0A4R5XIK4_9AGAM|nr:hypothetical protein BD410DRAFT_55168 [Rickenella mellea]
MFTYVIKGKLITLGMEHSVLLHLEFGRYGTVGGETVVRVDEPLPLVATHAWFLRKKGFSAYAAALNNIQRPLQRSDGYQEYLALLLCQAFRKSIPLQYLLNFYGDTPAWVEGESAEIIALRVDGDQKTARPVVPTSKVLGVQAESADGTLKWLANPNGVPFCFPDDEMGPEMVFMLRLSNQRLVWVLVRVSSIGEASTTKSVSPSTLFKQNPEVMTDVNRLLTSTPQLKTGQASGDVKIIRLVVSFSKSAAASASLQEALAQEAGNAEDKRYPLASLNMDKCMMVQDAQKATEAFMESSLLT